MVAVGSLVAGYRVERVLGQGGMGAVYLVANPELPRREALKLLSAELSRDEGFRARFLREADVASQLDHPNIVSIHRRGQTDDGHLWIAMQFVDGTDADEALRSRTMTPERAIHIVGEVAKALDFAHRHNVMHRDIKPANFLLSGPVGPDERVLLGDFGIARAFDDASLTGTGQVMATVSYAAPEVVSGEPVDRRADQYSLGCSLFRMLTGNTPFADAGGQANVMMAHLKKPPPRVSEQAPWLPPALDAVIATAMAKDPAQRFATCADFAAAAKAALRQPTPDSEATQRLVSRPPRQYHAPPPVHRPPGPPPPRQQPMPPVYPTPASYATPPSYPAPSPLPASPASQAPRSHRTKIIAALVGVVVLVAAIITAIAWPSGESGPAPTPTSTVTAATTTPAATTTTPSSSATAAPPAMVAVAQLPGLLLGTDELSSIMGAPLRSDTVRDTLWDDRNSVSDKDCLSAWMPAQSATYDGSGWSDIRSQVVKQPDVARDATSVAQAVVAFPSQDAARLTVLAVPGQWQACNGRTFTVDAANGPQPWTFGQQGMPAPGLYTMGITKQGGSNVCGRALTLRANVIIDVLACGPGITDQNVDIANKIAAKVPQ